MSDWLFGEENSILSFLSRNKKHPEDWKGSSQFPGVEWDNKHKNISTIFDLLSNKRRRFVISYLYCNECDKEGVGLRELSTQLASFENDCDIKDVSPNERKRVYVALYQTHLDRLDEENVVEYNADRQVVKEGEDIQLFFMFLHFIEEICIDEVS